VFITYYTLSIAYARSGAFDKALAIIDKARKEFPETMQLYEALGNIYYEKGDLELSAKNTLEMLRFGANPKNVYGIVIGRFQMKKQDSLAAQYYRQAIAQGVFSPGGR
jgi:tetratricopeptide (TPR) repeat protein